MPAKSKSQQAVMGMAMAMKEGKMPHSASSAAHKIMMSMSKKKIKEFASTKTKGLPKHVNLKKRMTSDGYMKS